MTETEKPSPEEITTAQRAQLTKRVTEAEEALKLIEEKRAAEGRILVNLPEARAPQDVTKLLDDLSQFPHPNEYYAQKGKTLRDYWEWVNGNASTNPINLLHRAFFRVTANMGDDETKKLQRTLHWAKDDLRRFETSRDPKFLNWSAKTQVSYKQHAYHDATQYDVPLFRPVLTDADREELSWEVEVFTRCRPYVGTSWNGSLDYLDEKHALVTFNWPIGD